MSEERVPQVGDIVHLIHQQRCHAAIVTSVDDNGTGLHPFGAPDEDSTEAPPDDWHPYNSLHSARPTSGWHWQDEHQ